MNSIPTCERHPKYRGLHRPKTKCEMCWIVWLTRRFDLLNHRVTNVEYTPPLELQLGNSKVWG